MLFYIVAARRRQVPDSGKVEELYSIRSFYSHNRIILTSCFAESETFPADTTAFAMFANDLNVILDANHQDKI